jgi:hypothetical protein
MPLTVASPSWCAAVVIQVEGDAIGLHLDSSEVGEPLCVRWQAPSEREGAGDAVVLARCDEASEQPPAMTGQGSWWFPVAPVPGGLCLNSGARESPAAGTRCAQCWCAMQLPQRVASRLTLQAARHCRRRAMAQATLQRG